jgi:hypothetical protein
MFIFLSRDSGSSHHVLLHWVAFYDQLLKAAIGKSKIINKALQDIGMGRYQWHLFSLCGMGWLADKHVFTIVSQSK